MNTVLSIIRKKPPLFLLVSLGYLVLVALGKWGTHPVLATGFFAFGGLVGVYFLDAAEEFFHLTPSPFRSIVFAALFIIVALFIVTSSGSMFAAGLVLSLYLTMILWQIGEWQIQKNLRDWYRMVNGPVSTQVQMWFIIAFIGIFFIETVKSKRYWW